MSNKFRKVKNYYDSGLWSKSRVHDAVGKGWITADENTTCLRFFAKPRGKAKIRDPGRFRKP